MNKTDLIQKVKALDGLSQDERAYLINLVNTKKKYGLVWEDKPEEVEEQLRENLPVLKEAKDKAIVNGEEYPNHILIEGDNLHALTALSFTHEGKIDLIYIDPPYNTGNNDFKYNDTYVDKEDAFRHSKWISFMTKRLEISKRLLSGKGIIVISIGDDEQAQLKLLLDEIFYPQNFVSNTIRQAVKGGTRSKSLIGQNHDYVLIYAKDKTQCLIKGRVVEGHVLNLNDDKGPYMKGRELNKWGAGSRREDSPTMWFPIKGPNGEDVYPIRNDNTEGRWRWGKKKLIKAVKDKEVLFELRDNGTYIAYEKIRDDGEREIAHGSLLIDSQFSNANGTEDLKEIFDGKSPFSYPKPMNLINHLLNLAPPSDITILDFFAGSGTTLHSAMLLNDEDDGNRKCIIVTNNENGICEEVTYERSKRVIRGFNNPKNEKVDGLIRNNLRYYKTDFVNRETSLKNKRELTQLATELLCIKEGCYTEQKIKIKQAKLFANASVTLLILFDDHIIPDAVELIKGMDAKEIKVYVFSMGSDPYTEDFAEVLDKVTLCALPDAIYKAYQNVLPKKKRTVPLMEEVSETPTNENGEQLSIL
jgi:adenine-specific DNA-methyltransferase